MKILHVIPYFVPAWSYGGPLQVSYNLSKELVRRGHKVTVYTSDTLDRWSRINLSKKELELDGIKVHYFKNLSNWLAGRHHIFITPFLLGVAAKELRGFDIIHLQDYRTFQNAVAYHYASKYGIPYVAQPHGALPRTAGKRWLRRLYDKIWGYPLLKDASRVIALTTREVEQCKSIGIKEEKIRILPNGINLSEFENLPGKGEFSRKYGLDDDQKIVLYLGRINRTKGLDLLAKAFASLSQESNSAKLVFVGPDDGYLPTLKRLTGELKIEGRVLFTGPLYGRERLKAYVDAQLYVLPSFYEGETFPISVLEAWACGLPVIVIDSCGIADMVDRKSGIVVPYNEQQLTAALSLMLRDEHMRQAFGQQGKTIVREHLNWEKISEQLESIYRECLPSS